MEMKVSPEIVSHLMDNRGLVWVRRDGRREECVRLESATDKAINLAGIWEPYGGITNIRTHDGIQLFSSRRK